MCSLMFYLFRRLPHLFTKDLALLQQFFDAVCNVSMMTGSPDLLTWQPVGQIWLADHTCIHRVMVIIQSFDTIGEYWSFVLLTPIFKLSPAFCNPQEKVINDWILLHMLESFWLVYCTNISIWMTNENRVFKHLRN